MVTLEELKDQVRERADMVNSQFVTDAELVAYINSSLANLHDMLIGAYNEEYFMEEYQFTSTGVIEYALPDDFYKLRGVDAQTGGRWISVKRFNFNKRNDESFVAELSGFSNMQYRIVGSNIRFNFSPSSGTVLRMFYHPKAAKLVADSDEYDDQNQYAEFVVIDAAIKCLNKEESDVSVLMAHRADQIARIVAMAQNRDANEPESVSDIYAEDGLVYLTRR